MRPCEELIWYVPFTAFAVYCLADLDVSLLWQGIITAFVPLKILLFVIRTRDDDYNGAFSRRNSGSI